MFEWLGARCCVGAGISVWVSVWNVRKMSCSLIGAGVCNVRGKSLSASRQNCRGALGSILVLGQVPFCVGAFVKVVGVGMCGMVIQEPK